MRKEEQMQFETVRAEKDNLQLSGLLLKIITVTCLYQFRRTSIAYNSAEAEVSWQLLQHHITKKKENENKVSVRLHTELTYHAQKRAVLKGSLLSIKSGFLKIMQLTGIHYFGCGIIIAHLQRPLIKQFMHISKFTPPPVCWQKARLWKQISLKQ